MATKAPLRWRFPGSGSGLTLGMLCGGAILILPLIAWAASGDNFVVALGRIAGCSVNVGSLGDLVTTYMCTFSRVATAIGVLIIMAAGVLYVMSGANPNLAGIAKGMVVTTLTGIIAMYSISLVAAILINTNIINKKDNTTTPPAAVGAPTGPTVAPTP